MLYKIYKWERTHYTRNAENGKWKKADTETLFVTPSWYEQLISKAEVNFWRAISSYFSIVTRYGITYTKSIRPDKLEKFEETFTPVSIYNAKVHAGYRELAALEQAETARCLECMENTSEHCVVRFGDDPAALYDLTTSQWVG